MITVEKITKVSLNDEECYQIMLREWNYYINYYKKIHKTFENWVKDTCLINEWVSIQLNHELSPQESCIINRKAVNKLIHAVIEHYRQDHKGKE